MKSHFRKLSVEKIEKLTTSRVSLTPQQPKRFNPQEMQSQNRTCLAGPAGTNNLKALRNPNDPSINCSADNSDAFYSACSGSLTMEKRKHALHF
ncbi:hypothetical protein NL676_020796 [Syzygium grande]|nr:hypothetical protein NL676_020796 [Syzygium grande]